MFREWFDISNDGKFLASSYNNEIKIWNANDYSLVKTFFEKGIENSGLAFSKDSKILLAIN